jgi:hypothetical protein
MPVYARFRPEGSKTGLKLPTSGNAILLLAQLWDAQLSYNALGRWVIPSLLSEVKGHLAADVPEVPPDHEHDPQRLPASFEQCQGLSIFVNGHHRVR